MTWMRCARPSPASALEAPQGYVHIDGQTNHAYLTPRIGRSNASGEFDVVYAASQPVRPDPYLVQTTPRYATAAQQAEAEARAMTEPRIIQNFLGYRALS